MPTQRLRTAVVGVLALASLVTLSACSPGGSSSSGSTSGSVNTDVGGTAATLTLFSGAGTKGYNQALVTAFEQKYPKITIKLQVEADNNYNTVLPRLLASGSAPDLVQPDLISSVKDGLISNLDAYAKAYGWDTSIPSTVLAAGRVSSKDVIGSGSLYEAGGSAGPLVGVFYNRDLAAKLGITAPPATLADFEADLAAAKSAGITPIIASNEDGLIGHLYSLLLAQYMGPDKLQAITWNEPGATLDTDAARAATTKLQSWMQDGYFNSDANAINQDASYGEFATGKGLFMVQGTWITQALPAAFAGKYGIFPLPAATAGGQLVSMTSNQLAFAISAKSKHKDAAALFLNFLGSSAAAKVAQANGYPTSSGTGATSVTFDQTATQQIQAGYTEVAKTNGFTNWLQNVNGAMTPAETTQLQLLLGGKTTPAAMVTALEAVVQQGSN